MRSVNVLAVLSLALVFFGCSEDSDSSSNSGGIAQGGMMVAGGAVTPDAPAGGDTTPQMGGTTPQMGGMPDPGGDDAPEPALADIVDTAVNNGNFTILAEALTKADLVDTLKGAGPFTVFAPTDEAFAAYLEETGLTKEALLADEKLGTILKYHVLEGKVESGALEPAQVVLTVAGLSAVITRSDDAVMVNNRATVDMPDLQATNGVIHVVDKVIPPANVVELASAHPAFSTLVSAVAKADLVTTLTDAEAVTVFAPSNDAFAAFIEATDGIDDAAALLEVPNLKQILTYHVLGSKALSTDLKEAQVVPTLADLSAVVTKSDADGVQVNAVSTVESADIIGTNGVIHGVSAVIAPATIAGLATAHPDFSILVEALVAADLASVFADETKEFTVFAPGNAAFEAVVSTPDNGVDSKEDLLALATLGDILKFHVTEGTVLAANVMNDQDVPTLLDGKSFKITIDAMSDVFAGGAKVVATDIKAVNGVIHQIEAVLFPPAD